MLYPAGRYNLNFDLCAGVLDLLLLISLLNKRNTRSSRVRIFISMLIFMIVAAFGEFGTGVLRNTGHGFGAFPVALTAVAHFSYITVEFVLALYVLELTGRAKGLSNARIMLLAAPEFIFTMSLILPWLRESIFYYDESGIYHRGMLYNIIYVSVVVFYSLYCLAIILWYRKVIHHDFVYVLGLYIGFLFSLLCELISPYLRASIFIQSLFLLGCTLLLGGEEQAADRDTGLYNSYELKKDIQKLWGTGYSTCVIAVKLQHLNYYSVMLGAETMHGVLKIIGDWLQQITAADRMNGYRAGNSEFALLLYNADQDAAMNLAEDIRERFTRPWFCHGISVTIPAQVWLTEVPEKVKTERQLNFFIDAGYNSKLPMGRVYVADEMKDEERRIDVEMAVKRALENGGLEVYYQPIYDSRTGKIHSAEALVRLHDPVMGMIPPDEFIAVAEQTGTISQIGEFVFESVCRFLSEGRAQFYGLEFVEVNLSTVQCMDMGLAKRLAAIAAKYDVPTSSINLEITESAVIYSEWMMKQVMQELQEEGFSFALDDFGTGHANYSYILNYSFRLIKIDKSFLWALNTKPENGVIFENMLQLIRGLDRKAVVEGVETKEQRDLLLEQGVDFLQGYYYSKPVPEKEFLTYLGKFNRG